MLPVLVIYMIVYFFARLDAYGDDAFKNLNKKKWYDVFLDGLFGTWFAGDGETD